MSYNIRKNIRLFLSSLRLDQRAIALGVLLLLIMGAVLAAQPHREPLSPKSPSRSTDTDTTPHRLAILTTPDNGPDTFLHIVEAGRPFPPPAAKFRHLPDAAVKGVVLSDSSVLVVADYEPGRDRSFGSALWRLVPGTEPTLLCDHIAFASRPLLTQDGRIFVQRGKAGPATSGGEMRVDELFVDEVDPRIGCVKTLWRDTGYIAYTAAAFRGDLVLYHIQPSGARLILVDEAGTEKVILPSLPPFASDFSVTNTGDLVFQNRDEEHTDLWVIERLSLISGKSERIQESSSSQQGPRAWPHGEVTWNNPERLRDVKSSRSARSHQGLVDIKAISADGTTAAAVISPVDSSDSYYVALLDPTGIETARISLPPHTPFAVAGLLP